MDKNQISNYLSDNIYSPKDQGPTTVVKNNMKAPILEGGYYTKNGCMRNLKYEIRSPKFYEVPINTEIKVNTDMDIKKLTWL